MLIGKIFFFQNSAVYYLSFFIFLLFLNFIFKFVCVYLSKNCWNFYVFLVYGLEIVSKNFEKSWNNISKKYKHLKSKFLYQFHPLLFVVLYCTDYRFYQRILENSLIVIQKIEIL